jgi:hypothetical protein
LEVHYHPGKTNVVADTLSQKHHCNSLLEDGFNLLYPVVLHNITISCSLESKIIELQKTDVGQFHVSHINTHLYWSLEKFYEVWNQKVT